MDDVMMHHNEPQIGDMLGKLQEIAAERGANAVVHIAYEMSLSSAGWHAFAVHGMAVVTGITEAPIGTDFKSQVEHSADLLDRGIITFAEYEESIDRLRRKHERFDG